MEKRETIQMDPLQRQMLDDVFDAFLMISGGAIVSLMHVEGGFTRYTPSAVELFDLPGEYIPNGAMDWNDYLHPEDRKRYMDVMMPLIRGETFSYDITYRVRLKNGEYNVFRAVGATLRNAEGKPSLIGGVMINQGITESVDPITILPNKYAFYKTLNRIMQADREALILLLGISKLSSINASHGYSYGNRVLQEVAWLIQETVHNRGLVYRMDDAAFAVVSEITSRAEMAAIYDSIHLKLQRGIRVQGNHHNLLSNGSMISVQGLNMDPATIYSCLNYAYRESKLHKHGELVDFNGSARYDTNGTLEMVNLIRDCIVDGCRGFSMVYQPVVDAKSGKINGAESLLRWEGEPYGRVEPMEFIPILERDFVFEELGTWILRRVMKDGLQFLEEDPDFSVSVNISSSQIEDEYFLDSMKELLEETGFPAKNLSLEINKGCRLLDLERLSEMLRALHQMGIRVGIDDYGTGFESIGFLKKFSADYIKFDRSLVQDIETDQEERETMGYLVKGAAVRGTSIIVKGVETAGMRDILRTYPVGSIQGNFYSRPLPAEKFKIYLASHHGKAEEN